MAASRCLLNATNPKLSIGIKFSSTTPRQRENEAPGTISPNPPVGSCAAEPLQSSFVLADTSGEELGYESSGPWVIGVDGVALVGFHLDA